MNCIILVITITITFDIAHFYTVTAKGALHLFPDLSGPHICSFLINLLNSLGSIYNQAATYGA